MLRLGYLPLIARWWWLKLRWRGRLKTDGLCFVCPGVKFEIGKTATVTLGRWSWLGHGCKVRAHEGQLQLGGARRRDRRGGERAEARGHAVDRLVGGEEAVDQRRTRGHGGAGSRAQRGPGAAARDPHHLVRAQPALGQHDLRAGLGAGRGLDLGVGGHAGNVATVAAAPRRPAAGDAGSTVTHATTRGPRSGRQWGR